MTVADIWREGGRLIVALACHACVGSWAVIHKSRSSCRRRLCHSLSACFRTPRCSEKPPRQNALQHLDPIWKDIQHRRIDLLVRALLTDVAPRQIAPIPAVNGPRWLTYQPLAFIEADSLNADPCGFFCCTDSHGCLDPFLRPICTPYCSTVSRQYDNSQRA